MNALEQEYLENVKRSERREQVRIVALVGVAVSVPACVAVGAAAFTGHADWILVGLVWAVGAAMEGCRRYASRTRFTPPPDDPPMQLDCGGYRDAPITTRVVNDREPSRVLPLVFLVVFSLAALILLIGWHPGPWSKFDEDRIGWLAIAFMTCVGALVKRAYDVWKKRHDAKLMLEWERRLEETK